MYRDKGTPEEKEQGTMNAIKKEIMEIRVYTKGEEFIGFYAGSREFNDLNEAIEFANSLPKSLKAKLVRYMTKRDEQGNPSFEFAIVEVRGSLCANKRAGVANETSIRRLSKLVALNTVIIKLAETETMKQFATIDELLTAIKAGA